MTIKELTENYVIQDMIVYCTSKSTNKYVKGEYFALTLQDASGSINGRVWDINSHIAEFAAKDFIKISGNVTSYKGALQININSVSNVDASEVNIDDFCPVAPRPIDSMWSELMCIVNSVDNEYLSELLHSFFDDPQIAERFKKNSAARSVHHAYVGGLLDHSISVARICDTLANNYPTINRDLLMTVAVLHDIGKIKEISAFPENDYTDAGNLLGHIYMGTEMIDSHIKQINGFPEVLANEIKHCILAHHGKMEFGSPKVPALIEASALNLADDTDAKLRRFSDILADNNGSWSERSDFVLGSNFRKTIV